MANFTLAPPSKVKAIAGQKKKKKPKKTKG